MQQLVKLGVQIMGRSLWLEIKEDDKDAEFLKIKVETALKILYERKWEIKDVAVP